MVTLMVCINFFANAALADICKWYDGASGVAIRALITFSELTMWSLKELTC